MKSDADLADLFAALAHPTRVAVLRALLRHFQTGLKFGDLAKELGASPSTLKHHLDEMHSAGVLRRTTYGRATLLSLDLSGLTDAASELARLCCVADPDPTPPTDKEPDP